MASKEAVALIEQVITEGRYRDNSIERAKVSVEFDLKKAFENHDIRTLRKLRDRYEKALKYIKEAKYKKYVEDGKYWELPEWIIAILFGISAVGIGVVSYLSSQKTRFSKDELKDIEKTLKEAIDKIDEFVNNENEVKQEAACILIEALNALLNE